jgi:hypothetical protein
MPNWCNNNLVLEHDDPAMIQRAFDALERGEFLNEFIPVPQELKDTVSGFHGDPETQRKLEEQTQSNIDKFGYGNWYDYCVGEWGTKWDVGEQGASDIHPGGKMLHTSFDSAWSPPVSAYEKLEAMGFRVEAMYYESGMGYAGTYSDGDDNTVELEGMSANDIEREYPELDECFGIAECMREYEDEEELTEWIKEGVEARSNQGESK